MKNLTQEQIAKITLFHHNQLTNDACIVCGGRCDPDGFDFGIDEALVCYTCAKKFRPDLVAIREAAFDFMQCEFVKHGELNLLIEKLKSQIAAFKIIGNRIREIGENDTTGEANYLKHFIAGECKPDADARDIKTLLDQLESIRNDYGFDCGDIPF